MEPAELQMNGVEFKDTVIHGYFDNGVGAVKHGDYTNNISMLGETTDYTNSISELGDATDYTDNIAELGNIHDGELKAENGFVAVHDKTEVCSMGQSVSTEGFEYKATRSYAANYSPTGENLRRRPLSTYEKREKENTTTHTKSFASSGGISRKIKCVFMLFVLLNLTGIYLICNESDDVTNLLSAMKSELFTSLGRIQDGGKNTSSPRVEKATGEVEGNHNKDTPPIEKKDGLKDSTPATKQKKGTKDPVPKAKKDSTHKATKGKVGEKKVRTK